MFGREKLELLFRAEVSVLSSGQLFMKFVMGAF